MHRPSPSSRRHFHRAYTLVEILLVLAILIVIAAIAVPSYYATLRGAALRSAAEQVRAEWNRAHIKAMKTGRIHVFRFQPNGRGFQVEPYQAADDALEASKPLSDFGPPPSPPAGNTKQDDSRTHLPEGIKFMEGVTAEAQRAKAVEESLGGAGGEWSSPILFFPDGVSSDAWLVVADEYNSAIRVELRGLTGLAIVGDITTPDLARKAD